MKVKRRLQLFLTSVAFLTAPALAQNGTQNPHGDIRWDCQQCHTLDSWDQMRQPMGFTHGETGFPLVGVHGKTRCASCHKDLRFVNAEPACANCHSDVHRGQLGAECQSCHTSEDWKNHREEFEQHAERGFALVGAHAIADCGACHGDQMPREFAGTATACAGCHGADYASTTTPNHAAAGFSQECESCHGRAALTWIGVEYVHPATFPLTAGHAGIACNSCHGASFAGVTNDCASCHETEYRETPDPDHVGAGFSLQCAECHTTVAWSPAELDHNVTSFPLTGAHVEVSCNDCHASGFSGTGSTCVACHESNYTEAEDPDHIAAGFPTNCSLCHNTTDWAPANLDHDLTDFPLTGAHVSVTCNTCHTSGYTGTSPECMACHENDYHEAVDPNHVSAGFPTECSACHSTIAWAPAEFDHSITDFPLTGAHVEVTCNNCHAAGFTGTASECAACHESDYAGAADPNHITAGFPTECTQCHTTTAWQPANLDHDLTGFPLTGAHVSVNCNSCHIAGYTGTSSDCNGCHNADYVNAPDPDHAAAGFSTACAECHSTTDWQPATLDHAITGFLLTGAHASVACENCHTSGFTGTASTCFACHESNFTSTEDPDHVGSGFPTECTQCHSTATWKPANLNHDLTDFPLTGLHVSVSCNSCHTSGYTGTASACFACHGDDYANAPDPNHVEAGFPTECSICHTTSGWNPANLDHNRTDFPLTGAHTSVTCENCHTSGYTGTASECLACHEADYASADDPNHAESGIPTTCDQCHSTTAWEPATFDHGLTDFPLTGAHQMTACADCHSGGYTNTSTLCYACHTADFTSAADPDHDGSGFSTNCEGCHTTSGWSPADYDHNLSDFPLTGAHAAVTCSNCHTAGFTGTPMECFACHESNYDGVSDPNHALAGFSTQCVECHTTTGWTPATLDHDITGFPLTGAHVAVSCNNCHASGYTGTSSSCFACHESDYSGTSNPNHALADFSTECTQCHTTDGWTPASFDHNTTGFALTGAHLSTACGQCHTTGYEGTSSDCIACHQTDFAAAGDPSHAGFPTDCAQCHGASAWEPATFDHDLTRFALTGMHEAVSCGSCHTSGYAGTQLECDACHHEAYLAAADPNHVTAGFSTYCAQCHTAAGWSPATLDHNLTGFPLTGAHRTTTCVACHSTGYSGTPTACDACHHNDYTGADPNHLLASFSTNCTQCHNTTKWEPSTWSHNQTSFALTGAHQSVSCNSCHASGFAGTASACYACHASDYTSVDDPDHVAGGFPTLCEQCHTTTAWTPSSFDHNQSSFPLTGAHTSVTCNSCHSSGYTGTPTKCDACHHSDYTGADPNHVLAAFSTDCTQCHNTSKWEPSTWSHNQTSFALTGAHQSVSCNSCHASGFAGTASACYACHGSDYTSVDDPDHVAGGFPTLCEQCHTTTAWTPSSFDHNQSGFPLTGAHTSVTCNSCHSSGYTGTPTACDACHHSDYTAADPNHTLAGFSTDCLQCHTTTRWDPSSWSHNQTGFALSGAHQSATCNSCHATGFAGTSSACYACHASDYTAVSDPDHVGGGFPTLCEQCHTTSAWSPSSFDHSLSGFPLTGSHISVMCNSCHASGYTGTPSACDACHHSDYTGVSDPNHVTAGFSTLCGQCHTTSDWTPASFDHNLTGFSLTGAHATTTCNSCHASGFTGTPTACLACHSSEYYGVTDPNHVSAGFSTLCATCHSTSGWTPATYDHNQSGFPLTGAHATVTCNSCHANGYTGTPSECFACHQNDYNTASPDHLAAGFPTLCQNCHTTTAWTPANWNHDAQYFPIYSGKHRDKWDDCADCHVNPANFGTFECIFCHEHNKTETDNEHNEEQGYQYLSTACYGCHPRGDS